MGYKLEVESDGNLGIYSKAEGSHPEIWVGNILEPESPNPVLTLGTPLGILGVQKILDLFKRWKTHRHPATGKRQPSPKAEKCRSPSRKWRMAYRAGK
jgi:hypothetical protein